MNRKVITILLILFSVVLVAELAMVGIWDRNTGDVLESVPGTEPVESREPTQVPTGEPEEATLPTQTQPEPTQPEKDRYVLTFAGDCTLGSTASGAASASSFITVVGEDHSYPFKNVVEYFENDDLTIINLEGPLTESGTPAGKRFAFKGPTAYTKILTGSSVEAVTLANNHAEDYGKEGYQNTTKALEEAGVSYVEKNKTTLVETESGLKVGLYAASFDFNKSNMASSIAELRSSGAEIVICAFHWGTEGSYRPTAEQENIAHAAIESGADIVYGSHPHVLQRVETYQDGYIFYSMGNFSFGGSTFPQDYDSAILQMEILRDENGKAKLGELTRIPVSISSVSSQNNYQPTPYQEGSKEYDRVMSKLDGTFKGADLVVDYGKLDGGTASAPTETATLPPQDDTGATAPADTPESGTEAPAATTPAPEAPAPTAPAVDTPAPTAPAPSPDPAPGGDGDSSGGDSAEG